ncbi:uncharacterized protein LOC141714348 [Apium graveolens]|uniref:uncharacterized protein LOC141714348 n=1 Tax=Apium graveolens TaxID=4045 RepID=UPI003D796921
MCVKVLPTVVAIQGKHVNVDEVCSWCRMFREDDMHVMFECSFAKQVWEAVGLQRLVDVQQNDTVKKVLKRVLNTGTTDQWIMQRAKEDGNKHHNHNSTGIQNWSKPPGGWIKINVDAACRPGDDFVGAGCVMRDDCGKFLRASSTRIRGKMQPKMAEAVSLREALSWTKQWRSNKCIFECDAKPVVDAVNGARGKSMFDTIVEDYSYLLKHYKEVLITFVHRSANIVAHKMAQTTYSETDLKEWYDYTPDFISCNLALEEI